MNTKISDDLKKAYIKVHHDQLSRYPISPFLTGKFAEHLGWNIQNGMSAEILRNPTFADYRYSLDRQGPDGQLLGCSSVDETKRRLESDARQFGWPASDALLMSDDYTAGLAAFWAKFGPNDSIRVSPDIGPSGGRAQRIEIISSESGICQWTWLPLHRVKSYTFRIILRSPNISAFTVRLYMEGQGKPVSAYHITGAAKCWKAFEGSLEVETGNPADVPYSVAITADTPGQFVISRFLLYPSDHIDGADPEVVTFLKESKLPILRWPGGNFVSGYHWKDAVGPQDMRPTRANPAWTGVEPNLFGTDEFIAFCRNVGCEPMICVNTGDGTPEEAAGWIEYCNGSADTPMGQLRAKNGHPEPYNVHFWEIGNELWGRWQVNWTTPAGYIDRAECFAAAMKKADPSIELIACGAPMLWDPEWNDTLVEKMADLPGDISTIADHILVGGTVPNITEPINVYLDFMAFPLWYEQQYTALKDEMLKAGIKEPHAAITEMQLFAHIGAGDNPSAEKKLNNENLVRPNTQAEALSNILHYHMAVRLAPFVNLITHSATVNHGGGLKKSREKTWADPCHYAQSMFAGLSGYTPVTIELTTPFIQPPLVIGDLQRVWDNDEGMGVIDAIAAISPTSNELVISVVNRGAKDIVRLEIDTSGFSENGSASITTLTADAPWERNTLNVSDVISPKVSAADITNGSLILDIPPFSYTQIRVI